MLSYPDRVEEYEAMLDSGFPSVVAWVRRLRRSGPVERSELRGLVYAYDRLGYDEQDTLRWIRRIWGIAPREAALSRTFLEEE